MRTKTIKAIIKQVGINGLIAIKNNYKGSTEKNIYSSLGYTAQNLIFLYLITVKDFKQYN